MFRTAKPDADYTQLFHFINFAEVFSGVFRTTVAAKVQNKRNSHLFNPPKAGADGFGKFLYFQVVAEKV